MRVRKHSYLVGVLVMLAGCIPLSLNPIYTDDVLVNDPRLEGVWGEDASESWTIAPAEDRAYTFTVRDDEEISEYTGRLIRLKDDYFLDLEVKSIPGYPDDLLTMQLVPAHTFFKVVFTDTGVRLDMLNMDWLTERCDRGRMRAPYARVEAFDNAPVFTGSPKRMQRFLRRWAHVEEAWSPGDEIKRLEN